MRHKKAPMIQGWVSITSSIGASALSLSAPPANSYEADLNDGTANVKRETYDNALIHR